MAHGRCRTSSLQGQSMNGRLRPHHLEPAHLDRRHHPAHRPHHPRPCRHLADQRRQPKKPQQRLPQRGHHHMDQLHRVNQPRRSHIHQRGHHRHRRVTTTWGTSGSGAILDNPGTINKSAGSITYIRSVFQNSGSVTVSAGELPDADQHHHHRILHIHRLGRRLLRAAAPTTFRPPPPSPART